MNYYKGDENKIEGEGWVHYAANNKLSQTGESDIDILWKNQRLGKVLPNREYDNYTAIDAKITSFTMEATFKGKNAEVFMNGQGYDKLPDTYKYHEKVKTVYHPDAIQITQTFDKSKIKEVITYQYVNRNLYLNKTTILSNYDDPIYGRPKKYTWYDPTYSITNESWTIRQDIYGSPPYDKYLGKTYRFVYDLGLPWNDIWKSFRNKK